MGIILAPVTRVQDALVGAWTSYVALVDVAHENTQLREELRKIHTTAPLTAEERAELTRLRALFRLEALEEVSGFGARIIATRFGPQALLKSLTVNKGFADGALVGTPVVSAAGVVGRVLRTAPHAATILLLTDPTFRLAVISQETRTPGIITGLPGNEGLLELTYVAQNAHILKDELLITAGVDGIFPKGIPVGIVTHVGPGHETLFQQVYVRPLVNFEKLEEVLVLHPVGYGPALRHKSPEIPLEQAIAAANANGTARTGSANATLPASSNATLRGGASGNGNATAPSRRQSTPRNAGTANATQR